MILNGDLNRVKYIGCKMSGGEIVCNGNVDLHVGAEMSVAEMAAERERLEAERAESQKMMAELLQLKRELSGKGGDDLSPPQEEAPPDEKTEEVVKGE